ncbi:MAG TPA: hypothetical protein PKC24_11535, partial [Cyclobacteriaceae bacterium]|nr:hypothetical protein [Cyclobacteriaceae bacterium]
KIWIPTTGGSWTLGANWTGGVAPIAGDDVIINSDQSANITDVPDITLGSLSISGNCLLQAATSGNTVSVSSLFNVIAGKTIIFGAGGGRLNFTLQASATGQVSGTATIAAGGTTARTFLNEGDLSIPPGGLVSGTGAASTFVTATSSTLRIGSVDGITSSGATGSIQFEGPRTFSTAANYHYIGNNNQNTGNGLPASVQSLTINNSGTPGNNVVSLLANLAITNQLIVLNGSLDLIANNITTVSGIELSGTTITGTGIISLNGDLVTNASASTASISAPVSLLTTSTLNIADGAAAPDLQINSVISGAFGIIKEGTGIFLASGANSYTGSTLINSGILRLGSSGDGTNSPLGTIAAGTVVASGASIDLNGFSLSTAEPLTLNGTGISNGGALQNSSATASNFPGLISLGSNSNIIANNGAITLSNSGTITGNFNLVLGGSTGGSIASIIGTGTGNLSKVDNGAWTLSGLNTFSGGVTLHSGTININSSSAIGTGTFTINGGVINNTSGSAVTLSTNNVQIWNADFSFTGSNALNLGTGAVTLNVNIELSANNNILTIGGIISGVGFNLTKNGGGVLSFGANNVTLRNLSINNGSLISTSGTLNIAENFLNTGAFVNNAGTVNYNGGLTQNLAGVNYHNLLLTGAGTKVADATVTVASNLTNNAVLDMQGNSLLVIGSITNTGATIRFNGVTNGVAVNTGVIEYYGSSQIITPGDYFHLNINQSSGEALLGGAVYVDNQLTLTSRNLNLLDHILTLGETASISVVGASASKMIIVAPNGELRKRFAGDGSFTFPIGDNTGILEYSPISVNISGSLYSSGFIGVSVVDAKHPNNLSSVNFLTRYWNVTTSGIADAFADITASYTAADINGVEGNVAAAQLDGAFDATLNPWTKFGALAANTLSANSASLTDGQTSVFTGINGTDPLVSITNGDITICEGLSVVLNTTVTGGTAPYSYLWTGANLSSNTDANPVFTGSIVGGPTTYSVVVTDANGFTASDDIEITVDPTPTVTAIPLNTEICHSETTNISLTPAPNNIAGTTFSWTHLVLSGVVIGASDDSGTLIAQTLTTDNVGGVVRYTITPSANGCNGASVVVDVTVNPEPVGNTNVKAPVC